MSRSFDFETAATGTAAGHLTDLRVPVSLLSTATEPLLLFRLRVCFPFRFRESVVNRVLTAASRQ
jgi:hypothetical protein